MKFSPPAAVTRAVEGGRVLFRIDADALDGGLPSALGGGLIEQIRAGDQPNLLTLALAPGAGPARTTVVIGENATRVNVEIPAASAPAESSAAPAAPSATTPPGLLTLPASRAVFQTVIIDPGHGGADIGVRGRGGMEEKQLTLDVARRLRGLIEGRLGLRVVMTRDDDRPVTLDERAAVANNSKGSLFLSLHANGAPTASMSGTEVLYLKLDHGEWHCDCDFFQTRGRCSHTMALEMILDKMIVPAPVSE